MLFQNQFEHGAPALIDVLNSHALHDLPDEALVMDNKGQVWQRTFLNPKYGGDMIRQGGPLKDSICGLNYFNKHLPVVVMFVPKDEEVCKTACGYAADVGVNGSCSEKCMYLDKK